MFNSNAASHTHTGAELPQSRLDGVVWNLVANGGEASSWR